MPIFTLTIFLGAFLLFQVELIIGKTILPWFGGTSAVWITCMLFFQVLLLAGYAFGHALDRARAASQTLLHQLLLLATVAVLAAQVALWHSPLILDANWKPQAGGNPLLQILTLLAVSVGLPFLALASTAPLLQSWWRRLYPQRSPYPLYAVSNFGSFLGLVSYPFLIEPFLALKTQARIWAWSYAAFAVSCAYCALRAARAPMVDNYDAAPPASAGEGLNVAPGFSPALLDSSQGPTTRALEENVSGAGAAPFDSKGTDFPPNKGADEGLDVGVNVGVNVGPAFSPAVFDDARETSRTTTAESDNEAASFRGSGLQPRHKRPTSFGPLGPESTVRQLSPSSGLIALWLSLAACGSALLLATTNQLCKNVAAVPLLWVLPLAIYLLTFTLCFESDRRYSRKWFHPAFALGIFLACFVLATGAGKNLPAQIAIYSFGLFAACMICHGELARLKPDPRHLTLFYLVVAAGGVLGGLFVALLAPYLFLGYWEYEVSLWFAALLFLVVLYRDRDSWLYSPRVSAPIVLLGTAALLPESLALAIGSTQLAGSIPSVVVIVGALFFLQRQAKQRKAKPARVTAIVKTPEPVSGSENVGPGFSPAAFEGTHKTSPTTTSEPYVAPGFRPALFSDSFGGPADSPGTTAEANNAAPSFRGSGLQPRHKGGIFFQPLGPEATLSPIPTRRGQFPLLASCAVVLIVLAAMLTTVAKATLGQIASVRNFYGALTIDHQFPAERDREAYALKHGEIFHGFEFRAPQRHLIPTSYFSEDSGLGRLLAPHLHATDPAEFSGSAEGRGFSPDITAAYSSGPLGPEATPSLAVSSSAVPSAAAPLRIADVGLGIGTVAAYARPGDSVRFYEINPQVVMLASDPRYFQFLHDSSAPIDVVLGDGRLSLERELEQGAHNDFDVLIVDAFNGDAVPVHLLTIEAFELYAQRLKNPSGVLAMNVTNTFLDLRPVVIAAAERLGLASLWVHCDGDGLVSYTNDWVLISRDRQRLDAIAAATAPDAASHPNTHAAALQVPESRLWTDDYSNLFQALRDKSSPAISRRSR